MGRLSKIFQDDVEDGHDLKPMYENLQGETIVLGFEQFNPNRVESHIKLSDNVYPVTEINAQADSLEADIVLLETISGHNEYTPSQDRGLSTPNYRGLEIDKQKIELSEDSKKLFQEKGLDYRKVVANEGIIYKIKEIWDWIKEKISAWWDKLWGNSSSSSSSSEKTKEAVDNLKKDVKNAEKNMEEASNTLKEAGIDTSKDSETVMEEIQEAKKKATGEKKALLEKAEKAIKKTKKAVDVLNFNKYANLLFDKSGNLSVEGIGSELETYRTLLVGLTNTIDGINKTYINQVSAVVTELSAGTMTVDKFNEMKKTIHDNIFNAVKEGFFPDVVGETDGFIYSSVAMNKQIAFTSEGEDFAFKVMDTPEDAKGFHNIVEESQQKQFVEKFLVAFNENKLKGKYNALIKDLEKLIVNVDKVFHHNQAIGKTMKTIQDKLNVPAHITDDQAKLYGQASRYIQNLLVFANFLQEEVLRYHDFFGAFVNLLSGMSGNEGGAIVNPEVNWEMKKAKGSKEAFEDQPATGRPIDSASMEMYWDSSIRKFKYRRRH